MTWTGAVSADWTNSANWNPTTVPTATDTAVINSGNVLFATNSQFATLNLNGGYVFGPVSVASNSVMNWAAGRFSPGSSLVVQSNAVLYLTSGNQKELGGAMTNFGTVIWSGGTFNIMNNGVDYLGRVANLGLWQLQSDDQIAPWFGNDNGVFANGGTFRKSSGVGVSVINVPFINQYGTMDVQSGTVRFDHGQQLDGTFYAAPSAVVQLNGGTFNYTTQTRFVGGGQFLLTGGTLQNLLDYLPNLQLLGGTVALSPTYQTNGIITRLDLNGSALVGSNRVAGTFNFYNGGIYGPVTISSNAVLNWYAGRFAQGSSMTVETNGLVNLLGGSQKELGGALTNSGRVVWSGGNISVMNEASAYNGAIENLPGGLWEIQGDLGMSQYWGYNYAYFHNRGTVTRAAGTGTATIDVPFVNQGILDLPIGNLNFGTDFSASTGTVVFGIGSTAYGQLTVSGTASLSGTLGARLLNGFIPSVGANYAVINCGSLFGSFTNISGLNVGYGRYFTPVYGSTTLTLQTVQTNQVNNPPTLATIPNATIAEGAKLTFTNSANDPDGNVLTFAVVNAPTNATLGASTGVFSWTPTEGQGDSTNNISIRVFDNGSPSLSATQTFTVVVNKTNSVPVLPSIPAQLIGTTGTLTVTNTATDSDLPSNTLTYNFVSAPAGMTINSAGIISWSPTTPGTYQVTTRVVDNGTPALSATNTFTVSVIAKPTPPSGLVSWWTGDGTTADQNGLNDGTLAGSATYAAGLFGQAFNFSGGYLTVLHSASLSFAPTNPITIEMWVKRTQPGYPAYYFGKRVNCGTYNYQSPSDQFSGGLYDPPVGEWRHLAWVFTGSEMLGYVNGAIAYRTATTLGPENVAALFIGNSGTCNQPFVGLIDEARIYNRALSSNEVVTVYSAQNVGVPVVTLQPQSQRASLGSNVILTSTAAGQAPLSYQWRFKGTPIPAKTTTSLTLNNVAASDSGAYDVVISNALGVATSAVATLAVVQPPAIDVQPVSKTVGVGTPVGFTVVASGTATPTLSYQWRRNGVKLAGQTASSLNLASAQVSDAGSYDVIVDNWAGSATSAVATLTVNAPIIWTGIVSTDWNNRTNWNPQQVPTANDTAIINSGSVVLATNSQFATLDFNGGYIYGPVVVRSNCVMNWTSGRLAQGSSLLIQSNAVVNLSESGNKEFGGATTNFGRVVWTGGAIYLLNNGADFLGIVTNIGTWEMQGDLSLNQWFGNDLATFGNGGTFRKTAGAGVGVISSVFLNAAGTIEVQTGVLRFDHGQSLDGMFIVQTGAFMQFNSGTFNYTSQTHLTGSGQYQVVGNGTLIGLPDMFPNLQLIGGAVGLSANFQTNGTIAKLDLNGTTLIGSNTVSGTLSFNGGYISGPLVVRSNATFNWNAGRFAPGSSLIIESNGVANLQSGNQKELGGAMTNYGTVVWTGGTLSVMNNQSDYLGKIVNLGLWQLQGDFSLVPWFSGDAATFANGGIYRKSTGTGTAVIAIPFMNQYGTLDVQSGVLRFDHGEQLDGLYIAGSSAGIQFNAGTFNYTALTRLTGPGQYYLTGGTLQDLPDNLGNLQLLGGSVLLSPTFQTNGLISRLDLNGATLGGSNRVVGVLNMVNGAVAGPLVVVSNGVANCNGTYFYAPVTVSSNAVMNWYGGRIAPGSSLLVQTNAVLNLLGNAQKELGGWLTNYGTVVWISGPLSLINNANDYLGNVLNFGTWEIQGDLGLNQWFGNDVALFINHGVLRRRSGTGTTQIAAPYFGDGSIEETAGLLNFSRAFSATNGTVTFGISSNDYGRISVSGGATLSGSLSAKLLDGYIPNTGAAFQVMTFASASGTFANTNGLSVGFGRYFVPTYSATALSLQTSITNGVNNAPTLAAIPNYTIAERSTLTFTNAAVDANGDQLFFALVGAPSNAVLNAINGVFTWTPAETQTNTTNNITLRVYDNGSPSLSATQSFTVTVFKTNSAPVLPQIATQLIGIGGTLTVTNSATDTDLPADSLSYNLVSAPAGMLISGNGVITWAPSSAGSFSVTTRVVDNGTPALSATNTFTVSVIAKPNPPAGLVSWWTGDGTTGDQMGINAGVLAGNASYTAGLYGQAFNFSGGYMSVLHSASLSFASTNALTVELWAKKTQPGYPVYYFGKRIGCGSANYQSPSDQINGGYYDSPVGEWRHFAWVFTGSKVLSYVNGALVYQSEGTLGPENTASLFIGNSGTCNQPFVGLIDEPRIYNRALSSSEIAGVYSGQGVGGPVLTSQPQSQRVVSGNNVTMNVTASGLAPLSYQWRMNGVPMAGQTTATLTLNNASTANSGNYDVIVTNSLGKVTSVTAALNVIQPPSIITPPQSQTAIVSSSVTLSVVANGTPTPSLSYQWRKNGTAIAGQTSSAMTINNVQVSDGATYDVIVANWAGSITSPAAIVSVSAPITWTGASSTDWNTTNNWNPQKVPGSTDTVIINSGNVVSVPNAQFYALILNGGNVFGPVTVRSNCLMYWNAGRLAQGSSLLIETNALVTMQNNGQKELAGATTNYGRVVWNGGLLYLMHNNSDFLGTVTNIGTWEMQGDLQMQPWFGSDTTALPTVAFSAKQQAMGRQ